jgi:hypothetical protein
MFLLLIGAIAGIALVTAAVMVVRVRSRGRRDRLARQNAAAQAQARARAAAQAEQQRRRAQDDPDDELTSVIPAIRLPWPTQLSAPREHGFPDLDGEYPQFSALSPFHASPAGPAPAEAPWYRPARRDDAQTVPPPRPEAAAPPPYPATPPPPAAWTERPLPVPAQDGRMAPAAVPAEHAEHTAAVERARRRPTHGSHRGGHARRRRG